MLEIKQKLQQSFPFKPYESQLALAVQIYESLAKPTKVTLLESPTGTGKSYAIIEGLMNYLKDLKNDQVILPEQKLVGAKGCDDLPDWFKIPTSKIKSKNKAQTEPTQNKPKLQKQHQASSLEDEFLCDYDSDDQGRQAFTMKPLGKKEQQTIYSSRTHSQIKQWIGEARRSKHNLRIVALGSRMQLCCNAQILSKANNQVSKLNHLCKMNKKACLFYKNHLKWLENRAAASDFSADVLDIEDLHKEGTKCSTCPYYTSKALVEFADIVCLPYQLLVENIEKLNQPNIVIDEAHNFGAALLQAQSAQVSAKVLQTTIAGLESYRKAYNNRVKAKTLYYLLQLQKLAQTMLSKFKDRQDHVQILDFMVAIGFGNFEVAKMIRFLQNKEMRRRVGGFVDSQRNVQNYSNLESVCGFLTSLIQASSDDAILYVDSNSAIHLSYINNSQIFQKLVQKCRALLFLGGTLQPLNEFEEFKSKVASEEEFLFAQYPHIISPERCRLFICEARFEYSLKNKNDQFESLLEQTSEILQDVSRQVPKGIVAFMQSYTMLSKLKEYFQSKGTQFKQKIFYDGDGKDVFSEYSKCVPEGAILISVVGGTLSEGINFSDDLARGVVVFGVPFPSLDSLELQQQIKTNGSEYYENLTMRAVNQCIGRVIRHKNDYGLLFLVDRRFSSERLRGKLSKWLQDRISVVNQIGQLDYFFNNLASNTQ